jgi:transcriptional regulator with XRE-family HTH domain
VRDSVRVLFGRNLRSARERSRLSQAALGRQAGISASEVSRLEAGEREPRLSTILRLSEALDIGGDELIRGVR